MAIKCGACGEQHESVAAVRECSVRHPVLAGGTMRPGGEVERYLRNQQSLRDGKRDGQRVWLHDVAEGRATMEEYVAGRDDLDDEQKADALESFYRIPVRETGERMATPKMLRFVEGILKEREVPPTVADTIAEMAGTESLPFYEARKFINRYKDAPKKPRPNQATGVVMDLVDGVYRNPETGAIFKVYHTVHGANQQVAKRLRVLDESDRYTKTVRGKVVEVRAEFVYEGKDGLKGITPEMRMNLEEAKKYGAIYGVCIRCSTTLTKEESIERAMGPICADKANWAA